MPGVVLEMEPTAGPARGDYGFVVFHQKVVFEIDFPTQTLTGHTEITIVPQRRDLYHIKIDARQCVIPQGKITVNGMRVKKHSYEDRMKKLDMRSYVEWNAEQHEQQRERLKALTEEERADGALVIPLPAGVHVEEGDPMSEAAAATSSRAGASAVRYSSVAIDGRANTPTLTPRVGVDQSSRFQQLVVSIPFSVNRWRDGVHFAGLLEGDTQYPHVYSRHSMDPGTASSIFPCIDDPAMRCTWEVVVTCPKTLGDALKKQPRKEPSKESHPNGVVNGVSPEDDEIPLSDEDKGLEMVVKCSGELTGEADDPNDSSKKISTFNCVNIVAAQHIGFGIGPFEQVDLSEFREDVEEEKIGQGQSLPIFAYCLPGRSSEARHVCLPMAHAVDWFMLTFGSYPFSDYSILFVDGQVNDTEHTAGLSICSDRLLYPPDIIHPEMETTRALVHALASQWITVSLVAGQSVDRWLTIGLSHFMAGLFMKELCGENDYMFRQKQLSDELVRQDVDRTSIYNLGPLLNLGRYEMEFMKLKAPLVLFILDKRLFKFTSATAGLVRIISKLITQANIGTAIDSVITTTGFRKLCEKVTRYRQTEAFWNQWIKGAGCPRMHITHKFNKKRLCVEVIIQQVQAAASTSDKLNRASFLRELKEDAHGVYAGELRSVFTGSMTIRIHEADGSPYEHVVEIKTGHDTIQIPYSTKYKRVKRNMLKKDRMHAIAQGDASGEANEDMVLYSLGDTLQSDEDMREWDMQDWDDEIKKLMEMDNYEWIRIDSDFEWLCAKNLNMHTYMFVSQLQQDRDVAAQQESMLYFQNLVEFHPVAATILTRTLMDPRYFHGIRTMAAGFLKTHAVPPRWAGMIQLQKATSELFCYPGTMMPRSNDFSDRKLYNVELAIPHAMSNVRDTKGNCPKEAREFILDQLRFNDNTDNEFSDVHKISGLLRALTNSLIPQKGVVNVLDGDIEEDEPIQFRAKAIDELDRHLRMDEWINSYQNVLTTTVLECKMLLMKAKVIPVNKHEFLQYLVDGNLEQVRIKGFESLIELGFLSDAGVLKFLLACVSTDPSPFVRTRLFEVFVSGLAHLVLEQGKPEVDLVKIEPEGEGLRVENDVQTNGPEKTAEIARTTTIDGAKAALKEELKHNEVLKTALWKAIGSDALSLSEQLDLLDICLVLYDSNERLPVKLSKPRFWTVAKNGKTTLHFKKDGAFRERPAKPKPKPKPLPALPIASLPNVQPSPSVGSASTITVTPTGVPNLPPIRPGISSLGGSSTKLKLSIGAGTPKQGTPRQGTPTAAKPTPPPIIKSAPTPAVKLAATPTTKSAITPTMKSATTPITKPAPAQGAMKPPPKRPLESEGSSANQPPLKKPRTLIVRIQVPGPKLAAILAKRPIPSIAATGSKSEPLSKKRKSEPLPDSSNRKIKIEATAPPKDLSSVPKNTSTPSRSPAPVVQHTPNAIAGSVSAAVSSSPIASSASGVKPPRQRLPDAAPKPNTAPPVPPPTGVVAPKKTMLKIKLNTKPKIAPPTNGSPKPPS